MRILTRVPLAWFNLTHRPVRFVMYLASVGFAVVLMFVQMGFWGALLDSVCSVIYRMNADLVIVNRAKYGMVVTEPFPLRRLAQARAVAGVESTTPLYIRLALWKKSPEKPAAEDRPPGSAAAGEPSPPPQPSRQFIRVLAFDPAAGAMNIPEVVREARRLRLPNTAFRDRQSKPIYGMQEGEFSAELCDRTIRIVGSFDLGTDFSSNGNLIMSERNYALYFAGMTLSAAPLDDVEIGLVRLKTGADPKAVMEALQAALPEDVLIRTREEYADAERKYWKETTPVGFVFLMGLLVGFAVGVIICSQILSTDVSEHLAEYATLKAIGYTNGYLTGVILMEALLLSVLGFLPAVLVSKLVYLFLEGLTGLPLDLSVWRILGVLAWTVLMCTISGYLALWKVWMADPAEVFG